MKETPILFSAVMVTAILEGRKTMTRRVIKPQPTRKYAWHNCFDGFQFWTDDPLQGEKGSPESIKVPYGVIGDRLWVKETYALMCREAIPVCPCESDEERAKNHYYEYKADTGNPYPGEWPEEEARGYDEAPKWKSSRFMPRVAARIWLEITDVRAERVQDVSSGDVTAEGISLTMKLDPYDDSEWLKNQFHELWDSINARRGFSWDLNPWVWVITFKRAGNENAT